MLKKSAFHSIVFKRAEGKWLRALPAERLLREEVVFKRAEGKWPRALPAQWVVLRAIREPIIWMIETISTIAMTAAHTMSMRL